jgi:hypothetical protein
MIFLTLLLLLRLRQANLYNPRAKRRNLLSEVYLGNEAAVDFDAAGVP